MLQHVLGAGNMGTRWALRSFAIMTTIFWEDYDLLA